MARSGGHVTHSRFGAPRWVRTHPAPRFLVSGALTTVVDVSVLALLHAGAKIPLAPSTALAYAAALVVNFSLSRHWTFVAARIGKAHRQAARYSVLVVINLVATLAIVTGLSSLGLYYLLAKLVSIAVVSVANFFAYRHWVFR